tara:strand:+ start:1885 stop:2748 length:864 start_codon:yes stop_codon:yes gene_type:complete
MKKLELMSIGAIAIFLLGASFVAISADSPSTDINAQQETSAEPTDSADNQVIGVEKDNTSVPNLREKSSSDQGKQFVSDKKSAESVEPVGVENSERQALEDINKTLKFAIANQNKESSMPTYQKFLIGSGFLGFLLAVCNLIFTFVHRSEDKAKSIIDDFWLREVIIPRAIKPIEERILNSRFRYQDLTSLEASEIEELIKSLDELRYSISITDLISEDLMGSLEDLLDELSIIVATRSMPAQVYSADQNWKSTKTAGDPFFNCYKSMLFELMRTHKGLNVKHLFGA